MSKTGSLIKKKRNDILFYTVMIALPIAQFVIFYLAVNINSILLAFKSYFYEDGGQYKIVWFDNIFKAVRSFFTDSVMILSLKNSFWAFLASFLIGCTLAVLFSYYIYKKFPCSNFFKLMLFLPPASMSIFRKTKTAFPLRAVILLRFLRYAELTGTGFFKAAILPPCSVLRST